MNSLTTVRFGSTLTLFALALFAGGCAPESDSLEDADTLEALGEESQALGFHPPGELVLQDSISGTTAYTKNTEGWLRWAMSIPWSTGPVTDTTGASCDLGQSGSVWYLAGTESGPVTRECTIPQDKKLFFPLRNLWSIPPAQFVDEPSEVANFVAFFTSYFPQDRAATCSLTLRLDGEDLLPNLSALDQNLWVQTLEPFPIFVTPNDNWAGYAGGNMPAALVDGHYALLRPLSPGDHTLELGGAQCDKGSVIFETSAVYNLHVEGNEDCDH
jgi:hypothetical protein